MTFVQVKKIFRRCWLILLVFAINGCSSVSPTLQPSAQTNESIKVLPAVQKEVPTEDSMQNLIPFLEDKTVFIENLASEKPTDTDILAKHISDQWNVSQAFAKKVVILADKNAYEDFPKRNDILAIIAVESGFNPRASHKGSLGLMQIEKKSHIEKLAKRSLCDIAVNIEVGAKVLHEYFELVGKNIKSTLLSYNAGIGNFRKGRYNIKYYRKYLTQISALPKK